MLSYFETLKDDYNIIYSLDMIRLNFEFLNSINDDSFSDLIIKYETLHLVEVKRFYSKSGLGYKYLYNFNFNEDNNSCSFAIGIGLNCLSENNNRGFIEFNPNKCYQISYFKTFLNDLVNLCYEFKLIRYDVALDIPLSRNKIKMVKNSRCNYEYIYSEDHNITDGQILNRSITEYQGRRNKNKFCKLYDKTRESKLNYDLTRIEFTFDRDEIEFSNLPKFILYDIHLNPHVDMTLYNSKDLVIADLLRSTDDLNFYLNRLNYRYKMKIMPLLSDYDLKIDINCIKCIRDLALSYEF